MFATVSHYPRVSEWIYLDETAINMALVTSIEFRDEAGRAYALLRLSSGNYQHEVRDAGLVQLLREYVDQMLAPRSHA